MGKEYWLSYFRCGRVYRRSRKQAVSDWMRRKGLLGQEEMLNWGTYLTLDKLGMTASLDEVMLVGRIELFVQRWRCDVKSPLPSISLGSIQSTKANLLMAHSLFSGNSSIRKLSQPA